MLYRNNVCILSGDSSEFGTSGQPVPTFDQNTALVSRPVYGAKDFVSFQAGSQQTLTTAAAAGSTVAAVFPTNPNTGSAITNATFCRVEALGGVPMTVNINALGAVKVWPTGAGNAVLELNGGMVTSVTVGNLNATATAIDVILCGV
jgi:hypothetical protein